MSMMSRSFILLIVLSALQVSLALPVPAQIAQQQVIVEVQGTSCPFCAFGLEKRLSQIEGVADVKMDLKGGKATVTLKPGAQIAEEAFRQAIHDAGFTPGTVIYRSAEQGKR